MRELSGRIFLSATDLMRFMGCAHATTLDLAHMRGTGPESGDDTEDAALLQKQGDAHEAAHLAHLKEAGRTVMEIARGKLGENAEATPWRSLLVRTSCFRARFCRETGAAGPTSWNVSRNLCAWIVQL